MKKNIPGYLLTILLFIAAFIFLYPLFLVLINSMKTFQEVVTDVVALPKKITFENYTKAFELMKYPNLFFNTLMVTVIGVSGIILVSSLAGYKLSRTKTKYSWLIFIICIAPMMIPFHSYMISLVKVAKMMHLINSTYGLGVIYWGLGAPLALFMYHGFVKTVPKEMDECALIDGCPPFKAYFRIIFPLLKPVTVSVIVLNMMWIWNDFLLPLLMLSGNQKSKTLQIAAYGFFGQYKIEWHYAMAGVLMTIIPPIIVFLLLQKHILKGMVAGAVKS